MAEEFDDLTKYLLKMGYVHCDDCKTVLLEGDLIEHNEREHRKIHHLSDKDQDSNEVESFDANNNVIKANKLKNGLNPFTTKPVDDVSIENIESPPLHRGKNSFFSSFNRENISPNKSATSRLAIKFPAKTEKHILFDENININSIEVNEASNLIDLCGIDDDSKIIADSTVLNENDSTNGNNPFKVHVEKPFDLENFTWNSEAGQSVVNAKNGHAHDSDNDDDGSMMGVLSSSSEPQAMNPSVNGNGPKNEPSNFDSERRYFVQCRECKSSVLSNTWHTHMKRSHNKVVDPDCVPDCENDYMMAEFCQKCLNIMPRSALKDHINRKHGANKKMIGTITRGGPQDDIFNKMVNDGQIYAKDGIILYNS